MGEPEQIMAEPDEAGEEVEGVHPPTLNQQTPQLISSALSSVVSLIASNGWYAVVLAILGYYLWLRVRPKLSQWKTHQEEMKEAAEYHKNPDKILERERAVDSARLRMQEEYNKRAELHAAKMKEMDEKKRQDRIEDWDRHQRGEGYRNKTRLNTVSSEPSTSTTAKPSGKPRLRPEYNPLTGEGGGSGRYRPDRRGPVGGG